MVNLSGERDFPRPAGEVYARLADLAFLMDCLPDLQAVTAVGEARQRSRSSVKDISSGRRGGLRSHEGSQGRTYDQLYNEARERGIRGRSRMNKRELERAVDRKTGRRP